MGDDYRVIARAVRQPMRQWWQRVGVWWIALIVLLLAVLAVVSVLDYQYWRHYQIGATFTPRSPVIEWLGLIPWMVIPVASLLWMMASFRVLAALDGLSRSTPAIGGDPRFLILRFRLVLTQAIWPVILCVAHGFLLVFYFNTSELGTEYWSQDDLITASANLSDGILFLIHAVWIAALLVQRPLRRAPVWLWWFALSGGWLYSFVMYAGIQLGLPSLPTTLWQEIDPTVACELRCIGFGIIVLAVYLLAAGRRSGGVLAVAIGIIGIVSAWHIGALVHHPADYSATRFMFDHFLAYIHTLHAWNPLVWPELNVYSSGPQITILALTFAPSIGVSPWLVWIALPIQALIAYGYYWFIRWLLVLGAARRQADATAAGM